MNIENDKLKRHNSFSNNCISSFSLLFTNMKESKRLLETYNDFIKKYLEAINSYYIELTELNCHFLDGNYKSSVIDTPIFYLGKSIKNAVQKQINNLFLILDSRVFIDFSKAVSEFSQILEESSNLIQSQSKSENIEPIANSLMTSYKDFENKIIDEYIGEKYNKHIPDLDKEPLNVNIDSICFLERTFLQFEEGQKKNFFNDLKTAEKKIVGVFVQMKKIVEKVIEMLDTNYNEFLNVLKDMKDEFVNSNIGEIADGTEELKFKKIDYSEAFKYIIKIIDNPKIKVESSDKIDDTQKKGEIEKNQDKKIKDDKDKTKDKTNKLDKKNTPIQYEEDNVLTLTEEDVYNIVKKIYDYDFKLLNKSDYNLEIEREKIKVLNYSKSLLSFDMEKNKMETITDEEVNEFYELLKKRKNFFHFLIFLNNYRTTGKYKLPERVYNIIIKILNIIEDDLMKNMEFTLENLCLILSQTFYILKEGKKLYLTEGIKVHPIFKKNEFWENHLNQMIEEDIHKIEAFSKKDEVKFTKEKKQQKINELILTKVIPISKNMSEFGVSKENILKIIEPIMTKYNVDQSSRAMIISIMDQEDDI